jgi:hypothetical protein
MEVQNYKLEILVNGRPIREYPHSDGLTYVEGRKGSEFSLKVTNRSSGKIEAVVTVDGRSVRTNKVGSYADGGYLVPPYGHVIIPGWRLDNENTAHFYFADLEKSYATQTGNPENIGVIGCAIFKEKIVQPVFRSTPELYSRSLGDERTFRGTSKGIGTGFGRKTEHKVVEVPFERESNFPAAVLAIHYFERDELIRRGINLAPITQVANPFPGQDSGCTPPPGWNPRG